MARTPILGSISTRLQRIARLAREDAERSFLSLAHYIDIYWLWEAYARVRKDGAAGIDGVTAEEYGRDLGNNLRSLLDRFKSGRYQAPPVRRVHIPKGRGRETRPLGIPTLEDKVLQRAVTMILEAVYEQDFYDCSYGYRRGRSAHQALDVLRERSMEMNGGWVLEVDIQNFFEEIDPRFLRKFLDSRVRDGVLRRTIDKWLKAGVMENGCVSYPDLGTPQGGVISPLLANIYLHEVIDRWFEQEVRPRLLGQAYLLRFADDVLLVFSEKWDAHRVAAVLPKRLARYGLRLHPEKTRLIDFRRPPKWNRSSGFNPKRPGTIKWLGFTHYWGRSRRDTWVVQRRTASRRLSRTLQEIRRWCRKHRHMPLAWQQVKLAAKVRGHYAYFGIRGNSRALVRFNQRVRQAWQYWLNRRSQKGKMTWAKFNLLLKRYPLPRPRLIQSAQVT